jgi:hypothetical protein
MQVKYFALILFAASFWACSKKRPVATPSFYHFTTVLEPNNFEKKLLTQQKITALYIKFFDVVWDSIANQPLPVAKLIVKDTSYNYSSKIEIIPTVFITNKVFTQYKDVKTLANNINKLIAGTCTQNQFVFKEIQIDCDWTASTADAYFDFLLALQKLNTSVVHSVTLRLHQVKYKDKTGVPPVPKTMLMCYNMGNLTQYESKNSIIDPAIFNSYTGKLNEYPLPMDVALPLFSWYVHFTKQHYNGLVRSLPDSLLQQNCKAKNNNWFVVQKGFVYQNIIFSVNDELRFENSDAKTIMAVAKTLRSKLSNQQRRLALYHLDSVTLSKFTSDEIQNIFTSLN